MVMAGQHCECANATEMDMENSENGDFYVVYFATMKIIPFLGMIKKKEEIGALVSDCSGSRPWFHHLSAVCSLDQACVLF